MNLAVTKNNDKNESTFETLILRAQHNIIPVVNRPVPDLPPRS